MTPLSISEIIEDRLVSPLGIQLENLYGQKGNSSRWTVTELEIWESSQKKYGKHYVASRFQVGTKHPGCPSTCCTAKILQSPAMPYNTIPIKRYVIYLHFSIIPHKYLLPFPCGFTQSVFMVHIFHKFFLPPSLLFSKLYSSHGGNTLGGNGCLYRAVKNHSKGEDIKWADSQGH